MKAWTRLVGLVAVVGIGLIQAGAVDARQSSVQFELSVPSGSQPGTATALQLKLPAGVAAVDGRLLFDTNALELVGVAPTGRGHAFSPVDISGGAAFGAYGLKPGSVLQLVVVPQTASAINVTAVIDSAANGNGVRMATSATSPDTAPRRTASAVRTLVGQPVVTRQDLDQVEAGWQFSRQNGGACSSTDTADDANNDGCIDVVDVQALSVDVGQPAAINPQVQMVAPTAQLTGSQAVLQATSPSKLATSRLSANSSVTFTKTFTVTSTSDTPDATPGDGICADATGSCTLRAAMTEANWSKGPDFIGFNIPGTAPVQITIGNVLPFLNDQTGGTTIDAYTEPGSRVNTAQFGSNAIPGIAIQGSGNNPATNIFHITSPSNVIRGFALFRAHRIIGLSSATATGNSIVGNWFGTYGNGGVASYKALEDIYIDQGPSSNLIGTPDLADRNVIANAAKGIDQYGPGDNNNVIQNNVLCMSPNGAPATCSTGIDHDFGPKGTQIGGFGTNERNVIGPTTLNGIEISHGWDPAHQDTSDKWVNMNIHVEGNWIGFKIDGSYDSAYRSGLKTPGTNDGNAINIYDGCADNVVDGNYLASAFDGVNTMVANCHDNLIQNNTIGVSPLGQAAPMSWWGIHVRQGTFGTVIKNNVIRNAALGGIGLTSGNERTIEITQNIVSDTNGPAIHLQPATGSWAPGSDLLYAAPVITSVSTSTVAGTGIAGSSVEVYVSSRSSGQGGLPSTYLASVLVAGDGTWTTPVNLASGTSVTALEVAPNGNTSELSANAQVGGSTIVTKPVARFNWTQSSGTETVDFTDTSTNAPSTWKWSFGDGSTSSEQNPAHTYSATGSYSVKLTTSNSAGKTTKTKTITVVAPSKAK